MQDVDIPKRIAEIDEMFQLATGWGSWMAEASSERRGLVRRLAALGMTVPDAWLLTTAGVVQRDYNKEALMGFWFVTPPDGRSRNLATTKELVAFLRAHPGCLVTWKAK